MVVMLDQHQGPADTVGNSTYCQMPSLAEVQAKDMSNTYYITGIAFVLVDAAVTLIS